MGVQFANLRDVLVPRQEPAQAEMEKLMPERTLNSGSVGKPFAKEVDGPFERHPGGYPVIGIGYNASVRQRVDYPDRDLCRAKWLNKLLNRLFDNAD